jgi:hypothetical protein
MQLMEEGCALVKIGVQITETIASSIQRNRPALCSISLRVLE